MSLYSGFNTHLEQDGSQNAVNCFCKPGCHNKNQYKKQKQKFKKHQIKSFLKSGTAVRTCFCFETFFSE